MPDPASDFEETIFVLPEAQELACAFHPELCFHTPGDAFEYHGAFLVVFFQHAW
eukprot:CAMPEP_0115253206 /NCGR_PEP_ID=MMETSP0270-20121206/44550_1 /TAXON_ID=71861 /ORGANISM="Scrippsiella trochoidea, Strain CCMP3099" /LENGTH=53 /DNA_ID=CAMNT_0002668699 /DNA_START=30 /DNA_END=188 /DNA_ORIENTATION=-